MKGSCLCGKVEYQIKPPYKFFNYCHCSRCRKSTGSAHAANILLSKKQFIWLKGEDYLKRYELSTSDIFATTFCTECGSTMPWDVKGHNVIIVPAGTLDDPPEVFPERNIFWDSRADWYVSVDELEKFSESN
ncbi:MAG: GFA family protein [bacterium]|nr:GFA family protein [bacterium]